MQSTAVRRQAERADELLKAAQQPAPAQPGTPAAAPSAEEEVARLRAENERLTAAHSTLRGKYDAEVPRLHAELKEAKAGKEPPTPPADPKAAANPAELKTLTDDERNMMGEGYLAVTMKVVSEMVGPAIAEKLKPLNNKLDYLARMTDTQYRERLAERVPDWQRQNDEPGFYAWLQQSDPASGRLRHDLLTEADDLMQGNRVADIFLAYTEKREIGASRNGKQPSSSPAREQAGDPPPPALEVKGKIWTRGEIKKFYRDKRAMDAVEARKIEQDIFAAHNEGRVRD